MSESWAELAARLELSSYAGDPWELSPRQLVAWISVVDREDRRRDERAYTMMRSAVSISMCVDPKAAAEADRKLREAMFDE